VQRLLVVIALLVCATSARADDVHVIVKSGILERSEWLSGTWELVCVAPCAASVRRDALYRLVGRHPSKPMTLPADAIDVTFGAKADDRYAALLVGVSGLVSLLTGGILAAYGFLDPTVGAATGIIGSVLGGAGLITMVVGFAVHYATIPF
jgi:hypothetical protein